MQTRCQRQLQNIPISASGSDPSDESSSRLPKHRSRYFICFLTPPPKWGRANAVMALLSMSFTALAGCRTPEGGTTSLRPARSGLLIPCRRLSSTGVAASERSRGRVAAAAPPSQRGWSFRRGPSFRGAGYGNAGPTGRNNSWLEIFGAHFGGEPSMRVRVRVRSRQRSGRGSAPPVRTVFTYSSAALVARYRPPSLTRGVAWLVAGVACRVAGGGLSSGGMARGAARAPEKPRSSAIPGGASVVSPVSTHVGVRSNPTGPALEKLDVSRVVSASLVGVRGNGSRGRSRSSVNPVELNVWRVAFGASSPALVARSRPPHFHPGVFGSPGGSGSCGT